jgi:hypothetical protein
MGFVGEKEQISHMCHICTKWWSRPADALPRIATLNLIGGRTHEQSLG